MAHQGQSWDLIQEDFKEFLFFKNIILQCSVNSISSLLSAGEKAFWKASIWLFVWYGCICFEVLDRKTLNFI